MQREGETKNLYWDFIEDGGINWPEATSEEQIYFRELAAAFLRTTFTPPAGYVIDVLEAQFAWGRLPVIALGWNQDPEPLSLNECKEFIRRMKVTLNRFVHAVDWQEVGRIYHSIDIPGIEDLIQMLQRYANVLPLAQRCLETMLDPMATISLAPDPVSAAHLRDIHAKRPNETLPFETGWTRTVESSEALVPALTRMAEVGAMLCVHSVSTKEEKFFVITDAAIENLAVIQAIKDRRQE